jgi:membrane-bound metal-dependent hydrolase YbcI (DUF457 family)
VDVVSHIAFGRALVALAHRPGVARRALSGAIVVGAIAPDLDAVLMPFGWDRYLLWHERGTHTLLGVLVVAALLATAIRFVIQPLLRRATAQRPPWRLVWLAAIAGCGSHLLLDAVCGGSLHLLWPLTDARLNFSLVAMADPLLAGPLLLFLIVAAIWRRRAFELAVAVLIVMTAVLGMKAVSRAVALRRYAQTIAGETGDTGARLSSSKPIIEARWGSVADWYVYDRTPAEVRAWRIDAWSGAGDLYVHYPNIAGDRTDLIDASRQLDTVKHALSLFDFTFPDVIDREDGTVDVLWSDIRFCRPTMCDLRFGGRFDRSGRPLEQIVLIGTVRQSRSVSSSH